MNFPTDHIERIKEFGYTESEARFLYIVAVHSGYFTLGQSNPRPFRGSCVIQESRRRSICTRRTTAMKHGRRRGNI
jgi:hypothetical protein